MVTRSLKIAERTLSSLEAQTLKPEIAVTIGYPISNLSVGRLVCYYCNKILDKIPNLEQYEFILKSDEDVYYPPRFLEFNTKTDYDLQGGGSCLLIKTKPFLEYMKGRFIPNSIHAVLIHLIFKKKGLKSSWKYHTKVKPKIFRPQNTRGVRRGFEGGMESYRIGMPKFRRIRYYLYYFLKTKNLFYMMNFLGFMYTWFKRSQTYTIL
jgi:hypothetical protein